MSALPEQLDRVAAGQVALTISGVASKLRLMRGIDHLRPAFEPRILAAAIATQGRDLHSAWLHGVGRDAMEQRIGELICDLLHLGDVLGLDVEDAVRTRLARYRERIETPAERADGSIFG